MKEKLDLGNHFESTVGMRTPALCLLAALGWLALAATPGMPHTIR